jgi:hypothetical protein
MKLLVKDKRVYAFEEVSPRCIMQAVEGSKTRKRELHVTVETEP